MGALIWYGHSALTPAYEAMLQVSSPLGTPFTATHIIADTCAIAAVPLSLIILCLFFVSVHPEPVDDCPCFDDVIAFVAVIAGIALGEWYAVQNPSALPSTTRGALDFQDPTQLAMFVICSIAKVVSGVACIILWRVVAKRTLNVILPPIFKVVKPVFDLPRRFYVPAA
jgi:hypothetical protein